AEVLFQEHYVCMVNARHAAARRPRLGKRDFLQSNYALVGTGLSGHVLAEKLLRESNIGGHIVLRVPHFLTIPMIVANNDLIVTVPSRLGRAISTQVDVRLLAYPETIPHFPVSICWHSRERFNPENRWLRETFIKLFREPAPRRRAQKER